MVKKIPRLRAKTARTKTNHEDTKTQKEWAERFVYFVTSCLCGESSFAFDGLTSCYLRPRRRAGLLFFAAGFALVSVRFAGVEGCAVVSGS
jgi:hypothetical protein